MPRRNIRMATFEIELIHEQSGESVVIMMDYETDDPDAVLAGQWEIDFNRAIFDDISIVPLSYTESEE